MKSIRIIISGIMALLVAMPMCVCGHTLFPEQESQEHSCCPHHEEDKEPSESGHDCDLSHHDQLSFTSEEAETFDFRSVEAEATLFASFKYELRHPVYSNSLTVPPPDCFSHSSRTITYCNYRL